MKQPPHDPEAWGIRARENLLAAGYLAARTPPLLLPAVSRIYYACFQAACAMLVKAGRQPDTRNHGSVWLAADGMRPGIFFRLQGLHSWRRKADYATGEIPPDKARALIGTYSTLTRELGIQ